MADPAEEMLSEVDDLEDLEIDLDNNDAPASELSEIEREFGDEDEDEEEEEEQP